MLCLHQFFESGQQPLQAMQIHCLRKEGHVLIPNWHVPEYGVLDNPSKTRLRYNDSVEQEVKLLIALGWTQSVLTQNEIAALRVVIAYRD